MFQIILPPAKTGPVTLGLKEQNLLFWVPTLLISLAAKPRLPERLNLGKRSATATPMRAVAAWSWASARRISGRRLNRSEGNPTGPVGGVGGMGPPRARSLARKAGSLPRRTPML